MPTNTRPIQRALLSVFDKTGLVELAEALHKRGVVLISTGGSRAALEKAGIPVMDISEVTGFPEMMDGRVKTLHPKVHGGLLAMRGNPEHEAALLAHGIAPIDLLVGNLYPFRETLARGADFETIIENIDIGGPAMLRSSAKNHDGVCVVVDPRDYEALLAELDAHNGETRAVFRRSLAAKAFGHTAAYDRAISEWFSGVTKDGPKLAEEAPEATTELRYGENPHQKAAFYSDMRVDQPSIATAEQLWGKELSYNNIMDSDAALDLIMEFSEPACVILKHANPCGAALGENLEEAYRKAFAVDTTSAFGGIVGMNRTVDAATAKAIGDVFTEVVIAPAYTEEALAILTQKKNVRLLRVPGITNGVQAKQPMFFTRRVTGGLLLQDRDLGSVDLTKAQVVTKRGPTPDEMAALEFAWKIVKYVKSNAVVYAKKDQLIGVGAGQMSRVDSSRLAIIKAGNAGLSTRGSVVASDAFFPFRDGIDEAAGAGATAVVQPGGSVRDAEVIQAADEHNMAMIFTGMRHFRH